MAIGAHLRQHCECVWPVAGEGGILAVKSPQNRCPTPEAKHQNRRLTAPIFLGALVTAIELLSREAEQYLDPCQLVAITIETAVLRVSGGALPIRIF
jgi:hypothetical protein